MTGTVDIQELEEALKAATRGEWMVVVGSDPIADTGDYDSWIAIVSIVDGKATEIVRWYTDDERDEANARLIALMRNSLPTLIEALKRQGEALEKIAAGQFPETPDDEDMLDMAISGRRHMMALARAALTAHKEKSDV